MAVLGNRDDRTYTNNSWRQGLQRRLKEYEKKPNLYLSVVAKMNKFNVAKVVADATAQGFQFTLKGDKLLVIGPKGQFSDPTWKAIRHVKEGIVCQLKTQNSPEGGIQMENVTVPLSP